MRPLFVTSTRMRLRTVPRFPRLPPVDGGKRREVMPALKDRRSMAHSRQVDRLEDRPNVRPRERIRVAQMQSVLVNLPRRGETRMKVCGRLANRDNLNGLRESVPERRSQFGGPMRPFGIEVEYLANGVDARVGSAARVYPHMPPQHVGETSFDRVLDRVLFRLALPSRKTRAVVGAHTPPPLHGSVAGAAPPERRPSR